jgi:hypothetical protein
MYKNITYQNSTESVNLQFYAGITATFEKFSAYFCEADKALAAYCEISAGTDEISTETDKTLKFIIDSFKSLINRFIVAI